MNTVSLVLVGYGIGLLVSLLLFRPTKAYHDGFEAAKNLFKDWDDGYQTGWDAAFRQMERIASIWNHRDEREEK